MDHGRTMPQKTEPPLKVVGFHVEGASPSPRPSSLREAVKPASLSPVIIPPSFQTPGGRTPDVSPRLKKEETDQSTALKPSESAASAAQPPTQQPKLGQQPSDHATSAPANIAVLPTIDRSPRTKAGTPVVQSQPQPQGQGQGGLQEGRQHQQKVKPEMTRAERRALQEAQRAAKAAAKTGDERDGGAAPKLVKTSSTGSLVHSAGKPSRQTPIAAEPKPSQPSSAGPSQSSAASVTALGRTKVSKPNELFSHLPQYKAVMPESVASRAAAASIPPECVRLGLQMADGTIRGTNARCGAMLDAFAEAIPSFRTPTGKIFAREFGAALNAMVAFLVSCRPLSPAMGNVIKAIKAELGRIGGDPSLSDDQARAALLAFVASFSQEKVIFAQEALARQATDRIAPGDVVVTFARSSTVEAVLLAAAARGVRFATVIVDARPLLEGRTLLKRLLEAGIPCEYVLINGIQGALSRATKVLLGAAAVMSNGTVLSRVGTAAVAMAAADAHVPVIVCAETYKFHERVQLDCITYNELADPEALTRGHGTGPAAATLRQEWATNDNLSMLNLVYDTTPAEFVTMIVTEVGVLPPTSVPVVLREYRTAQEAQ